MVETYFINTIVTLDIRLRKERRRKDDRGEAIVYASSAVFKGH